MSQVIFNGGNFNGSCFNNDCNVYNCDVIPHQLKFTKDKLIHQIQELSPDDIVSVMKLLNEKLKNSNQPLSQNESSMFKKASQDYKNGRIDLVKKYLLEQATSIPFGVIASLIANAVGAVL